MKGGCGYDHAHSSSRAHACFAAPWPSSPRAPGLKPRRSPVGRCPPDWWARATRATRGLRLPAAVPAPIAPTRSSPPGRPRLEQRAMLAGSAFTGPHVAADTDADAAGVERRRSSRHECFYLQMVPCLLSPACCLDRLHRLLTGAASTPPPRRRLDLFQLSKCCTLMYPGHQSVADDMYAAHSNFRTLPRSHAIAAVCTCI